MLQLYMIFFSNSSTFIPTYSLLCDPSEGLLNWRPLSFLYAAFMSKSMWFLDLGVFHNIKIKIAFPTFDLHSGLHSCVFHGSRTHTANWGSLSRQFQTSQDNLLQVLLPDSSQVSTYLTLEERRDFKRYTKLTRIMHTGSKIRKWNNWACQKARSLWPWYLCPASFQEHHFLSLCVSTGFAHFLWSVSVVKWIHFPGIVNTMHFA